MAKFIPLFVGGGESPTGKPEVLCFTAVGGSASISITNNGSNANATKPKLYVSTDNSTWSEWNQNTITLPNANDKVYMYGDNMSFSYSTVDTSKFTFTGRIAISGNLLSLLSKEETVDIGEYCFTQLFYNGTSIVSGPDVKGGVAGYYAMNSTFYGCTNMVSMGEISFNELHSGACRSMFYNCSSLTEAPALPKIDIAAPYVFQDMFYYCTALTTAPTILPASVVMTSAYSSMFRYCSSLLNAPELPATVIGNSCYSSMFQGCTALKEAPTILPATTLSTGCYQNMFSQCQAITKAPELPAPAMASTCYGGMFTGCSNLNSVKVGATEWTTGNATNWLSNVSQTGTFTKLSGTAIPTGTNGIPSGWTVNNI